MRRGMHGSVKILRGTAEVAKLPRRVVHPKQRHIHRAALHALRHAVSHGDYGLLTKLIHAQPGVRHQEQLRAWATMYGGASYDAARRVLVKQRALDGAELRKAAAHPFWSLPHTPVGLDRAPSVPDVLESCRCCGAPAIPGDDICFSHLSE